jgi:hypothetical protein
MIELEYKPKHKAFEGSVKLKMPGSKDRVSLIRSLKFEAKKEDYNGVSIESIHDDMVVAERMIDIVGSHVVNLDLKHKESGKVFKSLQELDIYKEGSELIGEIGNVLLSGVSLGNG